MRNALQPMPPRPELAVEPIRYIDQDAVEFDVIVGFVRRSWRLCLIWLGVGLAAGVVFLHYVPAHYTAVSTIIFYDGSSRRTVGVADAVAPAFVDTQIEIMQSTDVLGRVVDQLGLVRDQEFGEGFSPSNPEARNVAISRIGQALSVRRIGTSDVVSVSLTSKDRQHSAAIANAIVQGYFKWRADAQRRDNEEAIAERRAPSGPSLISARVLTHAEPPLRPSSPKAILVVGAAMIAAMAIAFVHALIREVRNGPMKTLADVKRFTGVDWVAGVPKISKASLRNSDVVLPGRGKPRGLAITKLAARLRRAKGQKRRRFVIGVAAPASQAGTSSIAAHLADIFAKHGHKTLLIDANWQNASKGRSLPTSTREPGTPEGLSGVYFRHGQLEVLELRARQPITALAASDSIITAIRELREKYECVIVDFHSADRTGDVEAAIRVVSRWVAVVETWQTTSESLASFIAALPEDRIEGLLVNKHAFEPAGLPEELAGFFKPLVGACGAVLRLMAAVLPRRRPPLSSPDRPLTTALRRVLAACLIIVVLDLAPQPGAVGWKDSRSAETAGAVSTRLSPLLENGAENGSQQGNGTPNARRDPLALRP